MKTSILLKQIAFVGLSVSLLGSCAPTTTTYKLEPVSGDVATIDGRTVTKAEQNGVTVVASFEREDLEYVALDIELKNRTDNPIEVNPADFRLVALNATQDTLTDPVHPGAALIRTAADPTYEAGRMGFKRKQEEKRLKRAKIMNTVLMVALIASDVSSSGNNRSYREWAGNRVKHDVGYQALAVKRAIDHGTFANRMQRYDYEEYRWRELALRTNTVQPGESVRGFVYLPRVKDANYLAVSYAAPEQTAVPLLFRQEYVQERKRRRR